MQVASFDANSRSDSESDARVRGVRAVRTIARGDRPAPVCERHSPSTVGRGVADRDGFMFTVHRPSRPGKRAGEYLSGSPGSD